MARFNINDLKEEFKSLNWELISDKYINLSSQLEMICPEGHTIYMSYEKFRKNHICPICARKQLDLKENIETKPKKKGVARTLALDQATHVSGWSIYDNTDLIKYGTFTTKKNDDIDYRILQVKNYLINMIDFWKPDKVILEDIQLQQFGPKSSNNIEGVTTYKGLAKLQGVLINTLIEYGIEYSVVHTGTWRESCGIKGKSRTDRKKSAQLIVKDIYNVNVTQDEADAICIGLYATQKKNKNDTIISWE
jgi:Holliday junction resolvasome RuvABC endonuclease subunit